MTAPPPMPPEAPPPEAPPDAADRPRRSAAVWACLALAAAIALVPGEEEHRPAPSAPEEGPAAAPGPLAPPEPGEHRLEGRVLDGAGAGLPLALVRARRELSAEAEREARTDDGGGFSLEGLPPGRWLVRAAADGFSTTAAVVDVPGRPVELRIAPVGRIAGQVLGLDGAPAVAEIVLAGSGVWPARALTTGADGRFVLEDVPPGVYEVQARGADAAAQPRRGLVIDAGGRAFLTFHLEPGETMLARVVDAETEQPIAGAEIVIMEDALGVAPRALRSGQDGSARVAGLRASSHRVTVHADGYVPAIAEQWSPGTPLRIALEPGAIVSGVVVDARDRPIEGATLEVVGDATDRQPIALDGASVAFREHVFATHAAAMPAGLGALEVVADVPPLPLDGPVLELPGPGPAPAVALHAPMPGGYVTGPDGSFRITGVPPGHVQVLARAEGRAAGSSERVWVAPGGERDRVRIVLEPAGRVDGRVLDEHGEAVASVVVEHRSDGEPWPRTTITDAEGAFALADVAGAITLRAMPLDRAPVQVRLDVAPGAHESVRIELPAPGPTITGRTVDEDGHAIARAQVRLESMAPGALPPRIVFSDEDGAFAIDDAPGGPWRVTLDHPDHAQGVPRDLDDVSAPLTLVAEAGVIVRGSVIDPMLGDGIAGAEITLERAGVPPVIRSGRTGDDGSFSIPRAAPGRYAATIVASGRAPWDGTIEIALDRSGEQALDPIELASGATLEGDVVDALGQVIRGVEVGVEDALALAVRTDARGHFVLGGLAEGSHRILARHPAAGEVSRPIRVSAARDPAPIVLRMPLRYDPDRAASERALRHGVAAELEELEGAIAIASLGSTTRAARAGLRAGDVLLAVDGEEIVDLDGAERLLRGADGVEAVLDLERDGEPFRLRVPREAW